MRRVVFDSDVLLDVLMQRQPFFVASTKALDRAISGSVEGYLSGHAVTNLFYILRRSVGSEQARALLLSLLQHLRVASVTDEGIRQALASSMSDFEDAVTSAAAVLVGAEVILTRNVADFRESSVAAMTPADSLAG